MTAPPYEWPTASTGPGICAIALATYAASAAMPRSGLDTACTGTPAASSRSVTPAQLPESAKAPWTSATVGVEVGAWVMVHSCSGGTGSMSARCDHWAASVPRAARRYAVAWTIAARVAYVSRMVLRSMKSWTTPGYNHENPSWYAVRLDRAAEPMNDAPSLSTPPGAPPRIRERPQWRRRTGGTRAVRPRARPPWRTRRGRAGGGR